MADIDLSTLIPHGKIGSTITKNGLQAICDHSITSYVYSLVGESYKQHFLELSDKYRIPFTIEMTLTLDFPSMIMLIGGGHITFGSIMTSHKIEDIAKPSGKAAQDGWLYDDAIPFGQEFHLSVTYNKKEMQIIINSEERYYSQKQPYMRKENLEKMNAEGICLGLIVQKGSHLTIKKMTVTEFEEDTPCSHPGNWSSVRLKMPEKEKPTFESVLNKLPDEYKEDLLKADQVCRNLSTMKMKRTVDKGGEKIIYSAPDYGISYVFHIFDKAWNANFSWYVVTNGTADTWHRKADYMEEALVETAKYDKPLADRIFYLLNDCVCCYENGCLASTPYEYDGQKRVSCHGIVLLRPCHQDLADALAFFHYTDQLLARKKAEGTLQTEKIYLMK